eukprot:TRINITY_DN91016_c0_g1_i1.p1 TRINITY_DN91016_c0_g1~~TRINITY_DN91016_c0_g1_i1.p1  ORF type:complete len:250 (-),score=38.77 TRINITY_DN91016_c0_g1_i1:78-827(-)
MAAEMDYASIAQKCGDEGLRPQRGAVTFQDPREEGTAEVDVIAFYYPSREEPCDRLCRAGFLGNFHDVSGSGGLTVEAPSYQDSRTFTNAEAAFQALKFWSKVDSFVHLNGEQAFQRKLLLKGSEDFSYGGHGGNWQGMMAVLRGKFTPGSLLSDALYLTGDAYLLEHNSKTGRDTTWSNNGDGSGSNWLGMQLMLLRDELHSNGDEASRWTPFIESVIDVKTGAPIKDRWPQWQACVQDATHALLAKL